MPTRVDCNRENRGFDWSTTKPYPKGSIVVDPTQVKPDGTPKRFLEIACQDSMVGRRPAP